MADIQSQLNEDAYGSIADSYASKYNIPSESFRNLVRNLSGFDPTYSGPNGESGIAGAINNSSKLNAWDVNSQLDLLAQDFADRNKNSKTEADYNKAIQSYLGGGMPDSSNNPGVNAVSIADGTWFDKVSAWFKSNVYAALFFIIGVLIIIATIYSVVKNSSVSTN